MCQNLLSSCQSVSIATILKRSLQTRRGWNSPCPPFFPLPGGHASSRDRETPQNGARVTVIPKGRLISLVLHQLYWLNFTWKCCSYSTISDSSMTSPNITSTNYIENILSLKIDSTGFWTNIPSPTKYFSVISELSCLWKRLLRLLECFSFFFSIGVSKWPLYLEKSQLWRLDV